jgi:DNA modification methylase
MWHVGDLEDNSSQRLLVINNMSKEKFMHPTQKPVALFEYLIKTYTNEGDLVLDNCAGSFTTAIAAENLKRNWICIEKEANYCAIGKRRIEENRKRLLTLLDNIKIAEKRINENLLGKELEDVKD